MHLSRLTTRLTENRFSGGEQVAHLNYDGMAHRRTPQPPLQGMSGILQHHDRRLDEVKAAWEMNLAWKQTD